MNDLATVPWYPDRETYEAFRRAAGDSDVFFATFDQWLAAALEHEQRAATYGVTIIRIRMHLPAFEEWSRQTGRPNTHEGRSEFAEARGQLLLGRR